MRSGGTRRALLLGILLLATAHAHAATVTGSGNVLPSLYVFTDYDVDHHNRVATLYTSGIDGSGFCIVNQYDPQ